MKCRTCGTTLTAGALLCGECGTSAIAPRPTLGDTERYDRRALLDAIAREAATRAPTPGAAATGAAAPAHGPASPTGAAAPVDRDAPAGAGAAGHHSAHARSADAGPAPSARHGALTDASTPHPAHAGGIAPGESDSNIALGHADPGAAAGAPSATRGGPLFSLVFSTGESIRVSGSGLVGRNPAPRDGERFDYLVQIVDPERSVSKTHLEFGVEGDRLWIADRGSANGTRLGLDLVDPIDLAPGERMRVPRGTRIGIGDQYVDVH